MVKELWPIASGLNILIVPYFKLCEETSTIDEPFDLMLFYLAIALPFTDIPAKECEKHFTIDPYYVNARQKEEHG